MYSSYMYVSIICYMALLEIIDKHYNIMVTDMVQYLPGAPASRIEEAIRRECAKVGLKRDDIESLMLVGEEIDKIEGTLTIIACFCKSLLYIEYLFRVIC